MSFFTDTMFYFFIIENQVTAHLANRARVRQPMRESGYSEKFIFCHEKCVLTVMETGLDRHKDVGLRYE